MVERAKFLTETGQCADDQIRNFKFYNNVILPDIT